MSPSNERISVMILNSKGGVGKTTLAVAVTDLLQLSGRAPQLVEIDTRKRLSSFVGSENVKSFEGAPPISEIRQNPNLVLKHYDPIVAEMEKGDTLIDLGANEDPAFLEYCKLSRLDEDLVDMNIRVIALVPTVAETESVRGALQGLATLREVLPSAKRVLVLNERDQGSFDKLFSSADLKKLADEGVVLVRMPRIVSEGWDDFQRLKLRFVDVIAMDPAQIQERTGYTRPMAKRARGDMAAWFDDVRRAMVGVLPVVAD